MEGGCYSLTYRGVVFFNRSGGIFKLLTMGYSLSDRGGGGRGGGYRVRFYLQGIQAVGLVPLHKGAVEYGCFNFC